MPPTHATAGSGQDWGVPRPVSHPSRLPSRAPTEPMDEPMNEPMNDQADQASDHAPPGGYPDYPVVLSVSGRRCLVVGGGPVAAGKVGGLLRSGAQVTVVAPDVVGSIRTLADRPSTLAIEGRPYRDGEAADYELVVTATGVPGVDRLVVADALLEEARRALQRAGRPTGSVDWAAVLDHQVVPLVEAGRLQEARAVLLGLCGPMGSDRAGRIARVSRMNPESVLSLDEIDLSDLAFWERPWAEREGAFALLRRERPLALFEEPDMASLSPLGPPPGPGYRAVTRHGDVTEISRHPEIYCSGQGAVSIFDLPPEMVEYFAGMISTDNPRHARLRRIVSAASNPRRILSIENSIEEVADRVIDRASGLGECDFVTEIAAALPLEIICDMMGVPPSEYATVFHSSNVILSSGDPEFIPEGSDPVLAGLEAGQQLTGLMHELSAHRVDHPTDDLTTALISTNIDGESLTQAELASFFILLLTAGNETTRNAITHGLWAFTEHPDQRALWQADPATIATTGVDEIVRWGTPVIWMRRTVTEDTVLSGEELCAGDKVLLFYNSANRDEDVFEDPFRFDVRRNPNPHVGFGAAGPHFCLGAHLARREIDVMMRKLLVRLPDIEATAEPDRLRSPFINGIKHLPCRFTPA